jgi:hypothetical protein
MAFCESSNSARQMSKVAAKALALHPHEPGLWIKAAAWCAPGHCCCCCMGGMDGCMCAAASGLGLLLAEVPRQRLWRWAQAMLTIHAVITCRRVCPPAVQGV